MQVSIALNKIFQIGGKCVTCVMESILLPGQYCLHDADNNNVKVKSYSYGELNCGGLHILITFI